MRDLLELRAERAHLHMTSSRAQVQEQCDGVGGRGAWSCYFGSKSQL